MQTFSPSFRRNIYLSKLLFLGLCSILILTESVAQSITWGPASPPGLANDLHVYSGSSTASFEFTNGATPLSNATLQVDLGTGIEYIASTLTANTSGTSVVVENSVTGDNMAIFSLGNVSVGEEITITFERQATCLARDHKSTGGTFTSIFSVLSNGTEVSYTNNSGSAYSANFSVEDGNLILGAVTHTSGAATTVGGVVKRCMSITNGSFGEADDFWFHDDHVTTDAVLSNFEINGVAIPAGNISTSSNYLSIYFDASLIGLIDGSSGTLGDGDHLFEQDETFNLCYDIKPLFCGTNNSIPSSLSVFYGESEQLVCAPFGNTSTSISIKNGSPQVTVTSAVNPVIDLCKITTHSVTLTNNGTNPEDFAKDMIFYIGLRYNFDPVSDHNTNQMWGSTWKNTKHFSNITVGGNLITPSQIAGKYGTIVDYIPPDYLTTDPDGAGGLDDLDGDGYFDDLGPGQSVTVGYDMEITPDNLQCSDDTYANYVHWEHISMDIAWKNQCGSIQPPVRKEFDYRNLISNYNLSSFTTGPTDIDDGDNFTVTLKPYLFNSLACNGGNGYIGTDVNWTVKLVLPPGASLQPGAPTDPYYSTLNPSIYQSNDTVYYKINRYVYNYFTFPLTFDCNLSDGSQNLDFNFITTYDCGGCFVRDIHCYSVGSTSHCPTSCVGADTDDFIAERVTRGWTDQTMSTFVTLTKGVHGTDQILPFDTVKLCTKGHISDTISDNLHLRYSYKQTTAASIFKYVGGEITIYDVDGSYGNVVNTFPITLPPIESNPSVYSFEWDLDLSGYLDLIDPGYRLEDAAAMEADSFKVTLYKVYKINPGFDYYQLNDFKSSFYILDNTSSERSCDFYSQRMFYTGLTSSYGGQDVTLTGCDEVRTRASSGFQNQSGSIFPNEYRPITRLDSIVWILPAGIDIVDMTLYPGISGTVSFHKNPNGEVVAVPNSDYIPNTWRNTLTQGYYAHIVGNCELQDGINYGHTRYHNTWYNYHPNPALHQTKVYTKNNQPRITYIKPDLILTPLNQTQQGISDTIKWDIELCNGTGTLDVDFSWLTFDESTSTGIDVVEVFDITNGVEVQILSTNLGGSLEMIPMGNSLGSTCKTIRFVATYNDCSPDSLIIDMGWDCGAYPTDLTDLNNCSNETYLSVVPLAAQMAATFTDLASTPVNPSAPASGTFNKSGITMCEPFPVELTIVSSGTGSIYDVNFDVLLPGLGVGLNYIPNSATIEIEGVDASNSPRAIDPSGESAFLNASGATWNINLSDLDNTNFATGLGITGAGIDPANNEVTIRWMMETTCDFASGDNMEIKTYSRAGCSSPALSSGSTSIGSNLNVDGVVSPYAALLTTNISSLGNFEGCEDEKTMVIDVFISGGTTSNSDSLYILLAEGLAYSGIQNCTSANCPTYLGSQVVGGQEILTYSFPVGISNETMSLEIDVISNDNSICGSSSIEVKTTVNVGGVVCGANTCPSVKVITGLKDPAINFEKPTVNLYFNSIVYNANLNSFNYELLASNFGASSSSNLVIDIYCLDASGNIDYASGILDSLILPTIPSGQTLTLSDVFISNACAPLNGLGAVITQSSGTGYSNCLCSDYDTQSTDVRFGIVVNAKILLEGPFDPATGLMDDNLNTSGILPLNEPYTALGFQHLGTGGGETISPSILNTAGANAIVDWVFVELRDPTDFDIKIATRSALLQADGNIVDLDGTSFVFFEDTPEGQYYLVIRHRNHLAVMTPGAIPMNKTTAYLQDYTTGSAYGVLNSQNPQKHLGLGKFGLYECDYNHNGTIDAADRSLAWNFRNQGNYIVYDSNFNGVCDASERSRCWNNRNKISYAPD